MKERKEPMEPAGKIVDLPAPKPTRRDLQWRATDSGNADLLVELSEGNARHVARWNRWLVWDGSRWVLDDMERMKHFARLAADTLWEESKEIGGDDGLLLGKHALSCRAAKSVRAMLDLATSVFGVKVFPQELDADPWLLTTASGTVDLKTGALREHRRADFITKTTGHRYEPDTLPGIACPRWLTFLEEVLPDADTRDFMQRAAGYSLSGSTQEQCMFILSGSGSNGKTIFAETLLKAAGEYGLKTPAETLLLKSRDGIPNDLAALHGARLVVASETEDGRRLAEARIKELTGSDTISARFLHGEFFNFKPVCKLFLSTNHKPNIRGVDHAIWRRIRIVPFNERFGEGGKPADPELADKLEAELPGILAWAIQGAALWRERGLTPPAAVVEATAEYREEQDTVAAFVSECCETGPSYTDTAGHLFRCYVEWARANKETAATNHAFGRRLAELGFEKGIARHDGKVKRTWHGLRAVSQYEPGNG